MENQTIESEVKGFLESFRLFPDQASKVIERAKAATPSSLRWGSPVEAYPESILRLAKMAAKRSALEWIDTECPRHWARPCFVDGPPPLSEPAQPDPSLQP